MAKTIEQELEAFDNLNGMKPHAFTKEQLTKWLQEMDQKTLLELHLFAAPTPRSFVYEYPQCKDWELLVEPPYDAMYDYWLAAKIDLYNGETDKAANSMTMFNNEYRAYATWFLNTYNPGGGYSWIEPTSHFGR
jgi:hypothetical protein